MSAPGVDQPGATGARASRPMPRACCSACSCRITPWTAPPWAVGEHAAPHRRLARWQGGAPAVSVDRAVSQNLERVAFEAEVDRLLGGYLRIRLLAQSCKVEFETAGHEAAANGLVTPADWAMVRKAITGH